MSSNKNGGFVYILMNKSNKVMYVGATNSLLRRIMEHKTRFYPNSFSARYNVHKLVYFKFHDRVSDAFKKEQYIKGKSKKWKLDLIKSKNPEFIDLWDQRETLGLK